MYLSYYGFLLLYSPRSPWGQSGLRGANAVNEYQEKGHASV